MSQNNNQNSEDYTRLKKLIAGQNTDSEMADTLKKPAKLKLIIFISMWAIFLIYYIYLNFSNPPAYTYNFNPVSKIILRIKANDYIEEKHPQFEDSMDIDANTGMVKNKNGYTVT
ncbi:MAG: hypothetical protein J6K80_03590, partial [Oscillospiraceae bacterium]|nr:hypothetical protein [Oscillospiraceae bacterium]